MEIDKKIERILKENQLGIKIDIGCGERKQSGFVGIDIRNLSGVDIVHDLEKFPWPLPDECASFAMASHLVEHINPAGGIFLKFMDEVWRILKLDCQFIIATPYAGSPFYWQDPTHCNGCNETTWAYFDPMNPSSLYTIYCPKPWKIEKCTYNVEGNMEVVLSKRRVDKSYHVNEEKE